MKETFLLFDIKRKKKKGALSCYTRNKGIISCFRNSQGGAHNWVCPHQNLQRVRRGLGVVTAGMTHRGFSFTCRSGHPKHPQGVLQLHGPPEPLIVLIPLPVTLQISLYSYLPCPKSLTFVVPLCWKHCFMVTRMNESQKVSLDTPIVTWVTWQ